MAEAIEHLPQEASVSSYGIPRRIRKGEARQLLAQLDQLSSAQIDVLLSEAERQPFSA